MKTLLFLFLLGSLGFSKINASPIDGKWIPIDFDYRETIEIMLENGIFNLAIGEWEFTRATTFVFNETEELSLIGTFTFENEIIKTQIDEMVIDGIRATIKEVYDLMKEEGEINDHTFEEFLAELSGLLYYDAAKKTINFADMDFVLITNPRKLSSQIEGLQWSMQDMIQYLRQILPGFQFRQTDFGIFYGAAIEFHSNFSSAYNYTYLQRCENENVAKNLVDRAILQDDGAFSWGHFWFSIDNIDANDFVILRYYYFNQ